MRIPLRKKSQAPLALLLLLFAVALGWNEKQDRRQGAGPISSGLAAANLKVPANAANLASPTGEARDPLPSLSSPVPFASLVHALDAGQPLTFAADGLASQHLLLRPSKLFAPGFQITLGGNHEHRLDGEVRAYDGRAFRNGAGEAPALVTLVIAGSALRMEMHAPDGGQLTIMSEAEGGFKASLSTGNPHEGAECRVDAAAGVAAFAAPDIEVTSAPDWIAANLEAAPLVLELSGEDPATGLFDKFVDPIPFAAKYDQSLKDALLLLVLDKDATGDNAPVNLFEKASQSIARVANIAAVYENQLGIRLLLQELVMIPDDQVFTDVPSVDALGDFRDWCNENRPQRTFKWTSAIKQGAGLRSGTLGLANVARALQRDAVAVVRSDVDYSVLAHEMAHNFGSGHTNGGIMNGRAIPNHGRNFFTDIENKEGVTAVRDIYDYVRNLLDGQPAMRHPEEMAFAESDSARTSLGDPVTIRVLANDKDHVRHGAINSLLRVIETGRVAPAGAGRAALVANGNAVEFVPAPNFTGTAWFSYTLRGNVGNDGQGWLHKGDVAVEVDGVDEPPRVLRLQPGSSYSFFPPGAGNLTQPEQANAVRSEDDRGLVILRVNADAAGTDSFHAGRENYTIEYTEPGPVAEPDSVWIDEFRESIWISPLANDSGAGFPWLRQINPFIGLGAADVTALIPGQFFFPTSFVLTTLENRNPALGSVEIERLSITASGEIKPGTTGRLRFTPVPGARGTATIPYTVRDASGREAEGLITIHVGLGYDTLVTLDSPASVAVPSAETWPGLDGWVGLDFQESNDYWTRGKLGVGYEATWGYRDWIGADIQERMRGVTVGAFVRVLFDVRDTAAYTELGLRARYDDGFVAFLNGRRVASKNAPPQLVWNSAAAESHEQAADEPLAVFDLSQHRDLLRPGRNLLAIQVLNDEVDSSDLLIQPALVAYPMAPDVAMPPFEPVWHDAFLDWRRQFGGDPVGVDATPSVWDSDGDGFSDLAEFAVNTSPTDQAFRPSLELTVAHAGTRLTAFLRFTKRKRAQEFGISYVLEAARTLAPSNAGNPASAWSPVELDALEKQGAAINILPSPDPGLEIVEILIALDSRETPALYYRLRVDTQ